VFDGAPTFSPDGKSLVFVSAVGTGFNKLFRIDLASPGTRYAVTTGDSNENDPVFSPDGKRLYFTSDRTGPENIYSLELATGMLRQHTDVVTGAFMPTVLHETEGQERLVYGGYWKGSFDLYVTNTEEPVKEAQKVDIPPGPTQAKDLPPFEPDIQVSLDDANKEPYHGRKFFLEDAQTYIGVASDQSYLGRILLSFSDYLGDRRIFADEIGFIDPVKTAKLEASFDKPERVQCDRMKKFLNFVGEGVPAPFLHDIRRAHTAADFHRICAEFLDHDDPMALEPIAAPVRADACSIERGKEVTAGVVDFDIRHAAHG